MNYDNNSVQIHFKTTNISTVLSPEYSHKRKISKATPGPVQNINPASFSSRNFKENVVYVNPKQCRSQISSSCLSLLLSIGPFSAPQSEYSAYTYAIQNNRATAAVKLENTSNTTQ